MGLAGKTVTVLGGGIGGLTVALALRARGATVHVLEQADALREVGAGIQISPNGLRVLEALDLGQAFAAISTAGQAVSLRDGPSAREVVRLDLSFLPASQSYRFVHRAALVAVLAEAAQARGVTLLLDHKAVSVEPGARPCVTLTSGAHVFADLVVGADGLHSVVRPLLNGPSKPFFTGQVAWRAVVPNMVDHPAEARVHMGPGRHLVSYPLNDGASVNLVAVEERDSWADEGWAHTDTPDAMRTAFAGFGGDVPELLQAVTAPGLWGLFRHPVAQHWYGEGVALLGDAAHPTLPFMAQGANMAMEDAFVLADALDSAADQAEGLAHYQARRHARVTRVVETANGNARKYHLSNPLVRGVAHLGMSLLGRVAPQKMVRQFDWIYAHDVTRSA